METKMFYDAPRSISIGDIFYVIDTRERNNFSSPCRVCNDEKKLTVNGILLIAPSAAAIAHAKLSSKCNILLLQRLKCTLSNKKHQPIIGRYKIIAIYNFGYFANADTDTTATATILLAILRRTT